MEEKVCITVRDSKGAVMLRVSRETAERLTTDSRYASAILEQVRAAENNKVNPQIASVVTQTPVFPTPQPLVTQGPTSTPTPTPQPIVPHTPVCTQPATNLHTEQHCYYWS
ncbi:endoglucanase A [Perca fluviatilis]|uniref:endoglucanase A n=1 Tax=Perca fluviatilis TaxID=8168 RepID=UPI001962D328|nr:endoglucanase A [Perca fluviatilis]